MTEAIDFEVFEDAHAAARAAASVIADWLAAGLAEAERAVFVATGGRSPGEVYDLLSTLPLPWSEVTVTLSDERWVPPDSPDSNARMVRERLLTGEAAGATFAPLWSDVPTAEEGAIVAEEVIGDLLPADVVLLGMGEDGHIASLFPGSPVLDVGLDPTGPHLVLHAPAAEPAPVQDRVSLTLAALLRTYLIVILIGGETKRRVIEAGEGAPVHVLLAAAAQASVPVRVLWSP